MKTGTENGTGALLTVNSTDGTDKDRNGVRICIFI